MPYWIKFADGSGGCLERPLPEDYLALPAERRRKYAWSSFTPEDAKRLAGELTGKAVVEALSLPYPAAPRLNPQEWPGSGVCPSFCWSPATCAGRSSCPKRYSCVD